MSLGTVELDCDGMNRLLQTARVANRVDLWADVAMKWMRLAEGEIARLNLELGDLTDSKRLDKLEASVEVVATSSATMKIWFITTADENKTLRQVIDQR